MPKEKWFITKDGKDVRWIHTFINYNIIWDNGRTHLVFSMSNDCNSPHGANDGMIESISTKDCFLTKREAQQEILIRERFK